MYKLYTSLARITQQQNAAGAGVALVQVDNNSTGGFAWRMWSEVVNSL